MSKRILAVFAAATAICGSLPFAGFNAAAAPHATPQVQQVSLVSGPTHVMSSSQHQLKVQVTASQNTTFPSGDSVDVLLSTGSASQNEVHDWTFPVDASALSVDPSTGAGTLVVPDANIAPYGAISLTVTPIGNPTVQTCKGTASSQKQVVSLSGTFFVDSKSTGANRWGTVGSQTGTFTFAGTSRITWTYSGAQPCGDSTVTCFSGLYWQSQHGAASFQGAGTSTHGALFASRTTDLSTPVGATRDDEANVATSPLVVTKSGSSALLKVTASGGGAGSATMTGPGKGRSVDSVFCRKGGKKRTATTTSWDGAKYKNGKKPLAVHEQVFGSIKVANNSQSYFSQAKLS